MKRVLSMILCLALLCPFVQGKEAEPELWSRQEPGGQYVTWRLPVPGGEDLGWSESRFLCVRYADTKEPVALTSEYLQGYLFATVPAGEADRPLEVFQGQDHTFPDCVYEWDGGSYDNGPVGSDYLYIRGVLQGDSRGNLNPEDSLTRAQAAALFARLLDLKPGEDPGYADVDTADWYYPAVSAAREAGLLSPGETFRPEAAMSRAELTVLAARAMELVGWLRPEAGTEPAVENPQAIPQWALEAYRAFAPSGLGVFTTTYEYPPDGGEPLTRYLAEGEKAATRGETVTFLNDLHRRLSWYPTQQAIDLGFDGEMPVVDGSTSTYPYTQSLYGMLFANYRNHPQFPAAHSKSFDAYDRLLKGEVDMLFASTKPTRDTLDKAAAAGVELELIPIAYDAMVFFTNRENPMDNLEMEQITQIYVDNAYDNWAQLGGPDAILVPYCRNRDSGSQAQMEEFFLKGREIHPEIQEETTSTAMASVLTDVDGAYCESPLTYGLGYSIYYYYQQVTPVLLAPDRLKLLKVEGVYPSDTTIADGTYPLAGYNYAVVRSDTRSDAPARTLANFLLTPEGQRVVAGAGFGTLLSDPLGDFAKEYPGWEVVTDFPGQDGGYVVLARQPETGDLMAVYLERPMGTWGTMTQAQCPAGETGTLRWAVLGGRNCTIVFGWPEGDGTLHLHYGQGQEQEKKVAADTPFCFCLEGVWPREEMTLEQVP